MPKFTIDNTPSGWFAWGLTVGCAITALVSHFFGDMKIFDAPFITVPTLLVITLLFFGLVHLINRYGR